MKTATTNHTAQKKVTDILNHVLADEFVLYVKTRNFHWNVTGSDFHALHKFFEEQYEKLDGFVDDVAERVRTLGGRPFATLKEFSSNTHLTEIPGSHPDAKKMIAALTADHDQLVSSLREGVDLCAESYSDQGTSDFLCGLMQDHEKMAWMLRSHLE